MALNNGKLFCVTHASYSTIVLNKTQQAHTHHIPAHSNTQTYISPALIK